MASAGRPRRVLIVVQNLPVPFDRRVWLEATTLARAGYKVSVICPKARGYTASREILEGVDIHRYAVPFEARGTVGFVAEFAWCFARTFLKSVRVATLGRGFDAVHACNPPDTYWALGLFWKAFGKRFLFDHHDLSVEMYEAKFGHRGVAATGLELLERATFRVADVAIATNESHKRIAVERGGMDRRDVFVVRSGPDVERFTVHPADSSWKAGKEHLLVYLGEMCVQDGVDVLVRAVERLRRDKGRDDVHCVFVGGGPHQPAIVDYAGERGVEALCTFTGRVSDEELCRILSSADLAIDPDPKTPWSDKSTMNKIMEYMYFGLPIVAFDLCENAFSAGDAAVYAPGNDEAALVDLINDLLDDPQRRRRMAETGRRRVRESLAWSHSEPHLLAAYDRLFGEPSRARPVPWSRTARGSALDSARRPRVDCLRR